MRGSVREIGGEKRIFGENFQACYGALPEKTCKEQCCGVNAYFLRVGKCSEQQQQKLWPEDDPQQAVELNVCLILRLRDIICWFIEVQIATCSVGFGSNF